MQRASTVLQPWCNTYLCACVCVYHLGGIPILHHLPAVYCQSWSPFNNLQSKLPPDVFFFVLWRAQPAPLSYLLFTVLLLILLTPLYTPPPPTPPYISYYNE